VVSELRIDGLAVTYSPGSGMALVALHGASAGTRESSPLYRHLHETLPPHGVGVATFDRRGEGKSVGEPTRGRFEAQACDALAVATSLSAECVGLWGYSQGGWVAPLAAIRAPVRIGFVVTVGAPQVTPEEQMMYATRRQVELAGYDAEPALRLRRAFDAWAHGRGPAPDLAPATGEPWFDLTYLPRCLPDEEGRRQWIEEMDYDPRPALAALRAPRLAFYGDRDSWTPPPDEPTAVIVRDAEHDMTLPDGTISPQYEQTLVRWLFEAGHPEAHT
jgi:pimeloyl-ACP methyl ester carboxylesterase